MDEVEWTQGILNDLTFPQWPNHSGFDFGEMAVLFLDVDCHIPMERVNQRLSIMC